MNVVSEPKGMHVARLKADFVVAGDDDVGVHAVELYGAGEGDGCELCQLGMFVLLVCDVGEEVFGVSSDFGVECVWFFWVWWWW